MLLAVAAAVVAVAVVVVVVVRVGIVPLVVVVVTAAAVVVQRQMHPRCEVQRTRFDSTDRCCPRDCVATSGTQRHSACISKSAPSARADANYLDWFRKKLRLPKAFQQCKHFPHLGASATCWTRKDFVHQGLGPIWLLTGIADLYVLTSGCSTSHSTQNSPSSMKS